jgi:CHAD domain-containing protein
MPAPLPLTIRKEVAKELRRARRRLEGGGRIKERVHEARRELKKARAALRLVRGGIGEKTFRRENSPLRAVARRLSAVRDAQVLIDAFDRLAPRGFAAVRRRLLEESRRAQARALAQGSLLGGAKTLRHARRRAKRWGCAAADSETVFSGLERSYRNGRKAMRRSLDSGAEADFHEWRKQAKYLRYELQLLEDSWPAWVSRYCGELRALSDRLGDAHDLGLLDAKIHEAGLAVLIQARRRKLRAQAERMGRRLYAEKPKAFAARLRPRRFSAAI